MTGLLGSPTWAMLWQNVCLSFRYTACDFLGRACSISLLETNDCSSRLNGISILGSKFIVSTRVNLDGTAGLINCGRPSVENAMKRALPSVLGRGCGNRGLIRSRKAWDAAWRSASMEGH